MSKRGCAIVTGGSRGIGAEICRKLATDGFQVVVNFHNSKTAGDSVVKAIQSAGGEASSFRADVSQRQDVDQMISFAREKYGKIDVLVNNASSNIENHSIMDLSWSEFADQFDIQIKGAFNTIQAVLPHFIEQKQGRIINITSVFADTVPPPKTYGYVLAKSALTTFTKCLAVELGPQGIHVNNVSPGMTETSLLAKVPERTKMVTAMQTPLRRLGSVEDTANAVSFLANPSTTYITGETLRVCGGQQMI